LSATRGTQKDLSFAISTSFLNTRMVGRRLALKGAKCVFTGRFEFGFQRDCEAVTKRQGGKVVDDVTMDTHILVVGAGGNPLYLWKTYGKKIEKADRYRRQSERGRPLIIAEYDWFRRLS